MPESPEKIIRKIKEPIENIEVSSVLSTLSANFSRLVNDYVDDHDDDVGSDISDISEK